MNQNQNLYNVKISDLIFKSVKIQSEAVIEKLANTAIRSFRAIKETSISSDDSGLENLWDEYCFQCQSEQSDQFEMYEDSLSGLIELALDKLQKEDPVIHNMLFLYYAAFIEDQIFESDDYSGIPVEELVTHILSNIRNKACNYSNQRISKALYL